MYIEHHTYQFAKRTGIILRGALVIGETDRNMELLETKLVGSVAAQPCAEWSEQATKRRLRDSEKMGVDGEPTRRRVRMIIGSLDDGNDAEDEEEEEEGLNVSKDRRIFQKFNGWAIDTALTHVITGLGANLDSHKALTCSEVDSLGYFLEHRLNAALDAGPEAVEKLEPVLYKLQVCEGV